MAYTITELAAAAGVTARALRFYERNNLLTPARDGVGRVYSENDRLRLAEILKGKRLGFTLTEIAALLKEGETGPWLDLTPAKAFEQLKIMRERLAEVARAIPELESIAGIRGAAPGAVTLTPTAGGQSLAEVAGAGKPR